MVAAVGKLLVDVDVELVEFEFVEFELLPVEFPEPPLEIVEVMVRVFVVVMDCEFWFNPVETESEVKTVMVGVDDEFD